MKCIFNTQQNFYKRYINVYDMLISYKVLKNYNIKWIVFSFKNCILAQIIMANECSKQSY
jgi:hypothetical protein